MKFVMTIGVTAGALAIATWLLAGISMTGTNTLDEVVQMLVLGGILGLINTVIRPIVNFFALPAIVLSLGLMLLVTNALMLLLTDKISQEFELGLDVDGFWWALAGGAIVSVATFVIESMLPDTR